MILVHITLLHCPFSQPDHTRMRSPHPLLASQRLLFNPPIYYANHAPLIISDLPIMASRIRGAFDLRPFSSAGHWEAVRINILAWSLEVQVFGPCSQSYPWWGKRYEWDVLIVNGNILVHFPTSSVIAFTQKCVNHCQHKYTCGWYFTTLAKGDVSKDALNRCQMKNNRCPTPLLCLSASGGSCLSCSMSFST